MPNSVLEAIKMGLWDFEPKRVKSNEYEATRALPGTDEKLRVLADRVSQGLPLWHGSDCRDLEDLNGGDDFDR